MLLARNGGRPAPPALRAAAPVALALAALAGCSEPEPPAFLSLARGFEPRGLAELVAQWERDAGATTATRVEPQPPGLSLRREVAPSEWQAAADPGCFSIALPEGAFRSSGARPRLVGRGREYPRAAPDRNPAPGEIRLDGKHLLLRVPADMQQPPPTILVLAREGAAPTEHAIPSVAWRVGELPSSFRLEVPEALAREGPGAARLFAELVRVEEARALAPFEYRVEGERATLCWPEGSPGATELVARLENGRTVDGQWQLRLGGLCGNGIPVWSGAREEVVLDLPSQSRLSFRFAHGALLSGTPGARATARIHLDGALLLERTFEADPETRSVHVALALPPEARDGARLVFEVEGPPGLGAFFTPTVGPREHGTPLARPWRSRPDLVLFLADTFRADGLAAYGGDPALAPSLNRFAASALVFTHARSSAAWTLPSISSLLTGLHPGQHGATDEDLTLPAFHTTIADRLAQEGYRTGAITDGSFFAPVFGLDQGFEWFAQHDPERWDLDRTVREARAFLEEDDGRPVFLVVHTYRVHQPYRVGPEEDRSAYDALMERARVVAGTDSPAPEEGMQVLAQVAPELRALYQAGVRDLDRGFGELLAALEARRFFEHGALVVTSDHGEALGENHDFFHGRHLWEVKLRVPLLVRAPGTTAREVPYAATTLDLAPTLAELAGIARDPLWSGTSLLALGEERPALAFQLGARSRQVALLDGRRKVILTPDEEQLASGRCEEAYDLSADPGEASDLAGSAEWPGELTRRLAPLVRAALEPRGPPERAGITPELRDELEHLGYGGDGR